TAVYYSGPWQGHPQRLNIKVFCSHAPAEMEASDITPVYATDPCKSCFSFFISLFSLSLSLPLYLFLYFLFVPLTCLHPSLISPSAPPSLSLSLSLSLPLSLSLTSGDHTSALL